MLRRVFIFHVFLLCVCQTPIWAASILVPFQGEFEQNSQGRFQEVQHAFFLGNGNELGLARLQYLEYASSNTSIKAWSLLVYIQILLDNDSILPAKELLQDSILINWKKQQPWLRAYRNLNLATAEVYDGNHQLAQRYFEKVAVFSKTNEVTELKLLLMQAVAENLRYQGKLDQSLNKWYEALTLAELVVDSFSIADIHFGLAEVRCIEDELDLAEMHVHQAYSFYRRKKAKKAMAYGLALEGLLDYKRHNYQSSIEKNLEAYTLRKDIDDLKGQGQSLNNLALAYIGMQNWRQALSYLEEAMQLKVMAKDLTQTTAIFNNIGHCYSRLENPDKALSYFTLALNKAKENGQMGDVVKSYENIVGLHGRENEFEKAFLAQQRLIILKDSLADVYRSMEMNEMQLKYLTQKKELELQSLQQKQAIVTNRWLTLAIGLFFTIILGILFVDNQKRKHRQQTQLLTKEDELKKAELQIVTDLLEYNQNKLSLYTENLLRKNELVNQLQEKLNNAVDVKDKNSTQKQRLIQDFSAVRILTDEDWEEFKELFERVHEGMLDRLLSTYENLTLAEQRLFLLLKLNLSTKEIANILGVSPDSIKKGRYRLKKKIGIEDGTSIQDFVSSF